MVEFYERENTEFLPGGTLGVRFRMWMGGENVQMVKNCTARTRIVVENISFLHRVEKFSTLKAGEKKVLQIPSHSETGCVFTSTLCLKDASRNKEKVVVEISPSRTNYQLYGKKLSVINISGNIIEYYKYDYTSNYFPKFYSLTKQVILDRRKEYLQNDELSLLCEYTFRTGECHVKIEEILHDIPVAVFEQRYNIPHSKNDGKAAQKLSASISAREDTRLNHNNQCLDNVNLKANALFTSSINASPNLFGTYKQVINNDPHQKEFNAAEKLSNCPSALNDFKALYSDKILTDMVLKTATKSFQAHKNLLCARSSVFRAMLTNDMKEKNTGYINVEDLGNETVQKLLLFLYSDSLEELQWESAVQLYYAADKYAIEKLKVLCSSFLVYTISTSTASELLLLADTHNDTDL
ncbi:unnamed protein product [Larinioides sclopetarius]|uniref:BTB domain-containing protein n=1 Tax=Larinioides sclopetarius TaxID=280406 RepID=A0AAV2ACZ5_9ARAC